MQTMIRGLLLGLFFLLAATAAQAHKVNLFAYVEEKTVYTESYFPDGSKVVGGTIEVLDASGKKLVSGTSDVQGHFSFPLPKKEDLTITLDASMGHRASFVLPATEM